MKHQKTIEQDVINFIKRHKLLSNAKKIVLGLSGGADSIFALHFFIKYKKKYNLEIVSVHIDHQLRGEESKRDLEFCRETCKNNSVDFYSSEVDVKKYAKENKYSIEEAARILRYGELSKYCELVNADLIVTAHNNDDNTETVLLNIVNGTGIKGISGIPPKRANIIRPFLGVSKVDIINYLDSSRIDYVEDQSNLDINFDRNFIRKKIIPEIKNNLNPAVDKVISSSSEVFRNQSCALNFFIEKLIEEVLKYENNEISISVPKLIVYPKVVWGEFFRLVFEKTLDIEYSFSDSQKLSMLMDAQVGTLQKLRNNFIAVRDREKIILRPDDLQNKIFAEVGIGSSIEHNSQKITVNLVENPSTKFNSTRKNEYISGDNIKSNLILRNWEKGDKFQPFGMSGTKKVSDVLTDLKIPTFKRKEQLVLLNNNEIVWLVGQRVSDKYKVTSKTKRMLELCLS